jgi:hypothetical protein
MPTAHTAPHRSTPRADAPEACILCILAAILGSSSVVCEDPPSE